MDLSLGELRVIYAALLLYHTDLQRSDLEQTDATKTEKASRSLAMLNTVAAMGKVQAQMRTDEDAMRIAGREKRQ